MQKPFAPALAWALCSLPALIAAGDVFYVSPNGTGDGSSWADASPSLATAYAAAAAAGGGEVWMKAGTYVLTEAIPLKSGVAVRGGFAGTETSADAADPAANQTIVSGDVDGNNKWTVVGGSGLSGTPMWQDGVFTEPNPDGRDDYWHGNNNTYKADETTNAFVLAESGPLSGAAFSGITFTGFKSVVFRLEAAVEGGSVSFSDCKFLGVSIGANAAGEYSGSATFLTHGAAIASCNVAVRASSCEFVGTTRPIYLAFNVAHTAGAENSLTNCGFRANRYHCIYYGVTSTAKNNSHRLYVDNCTFKHNYTEDRSGAACVLKGEGTGDKNGDGVTVTFRDCVIEKNIIKNGSAGLLYLNGDYTHYNILRCRFAGNLVRAMKGWSCTTGVWAYRGYTLVRDCHFTENVVTNATTAGGSSNAYGASGIFHDYGTCDVMNCTFEGNQLFGASSAKLSSIYCSSYSHIAIANCTFADNAFAGNYTRAAEVLFSIDKTTTGATGSILNSVFDNDAEDYISLSTTLSSIQAKMFSIGFSAIPDYGVVTNKFAFFSDWGGNSTNKAMLARGRANGGLYARGVSSLSPFRNSGREIKISSRRLYGYLPEVSSSKPWNRLNENTQLTTISSAPLPDAFGKPRSAGRVSFGALEPASPMTRLSVR